MKILKLVMVITLLYGCKSSKFLEKYTLYKRDALKEQIVWVLFDKHSGTIVEFCKIPNDLKIYIGISRDVSVIKAGYYLRDGAGYMQSYPFTGYSFSKRFSSLDEVIEYADSNWYKYKELLSTRFLDNDETIIRYCSDCLEKQVYKKIDLP